MTVTLREITFASSGIQRGAWHLSASNATLADANGRPCVVMGFGDSGGHVVPVAVADGRIAAPAPSPSSSGTGSATPRAPCSSHAASHPDRRPARC